MLQIIVCVCGLLMLASAGFAQTAAEPQWQLEYQDRFKPGALGPDWTILRGDWHINKAGQLQIQRQWPSHSFIMCEHPLRGKNVKVSFKLTIPGGEQAGEFGAFLQAGELGWGGGGIDHRAGLFLQPVAPNTPNTPFHVATDQPHQVTLQLVDGQFIAKVNDKTVVEQTVPQGQSLVNHGLQFSAIRGGRVEQVRIWTAPMKASISNRPLGDDSLAQENRKATVRADAYIDHGKPDCGIQAAIDALPAGGGVVILPEGRFLLRRFLDLPSHVTLQGQGPKTELRCIDATAAEIVSFSSQGELHTLTLKGPHDFKAGDSFSYDRCWGHPINARKPGELGLPHMLGGQSKAENRLLILAVEGDRVTVNLPPPLGDKNKRIVHFFPPICSFQSEWVTVRDLKIVGPAANPAGVGGGFQTNPITFGVTSHARMERLIIENFPADGISAQGADDARFFDCTIRGTYNGLHPGTTTLRTMVGRNLSVDNASGQYFCWYNSQGIYFRNRLRNFTGYPDAGDVFNTIACNDMTDAMSLTVGFNGVLVGNRMPALTVFQFSGKEARPPSVLGPGSRTYGMPPRYFNISANRVDKLQVYRWARGNVLAHNLASNDQPAAIDWRLTPTQADDHPELDQNVALAEVGPSDLPPMPPAIERTEPLPPPALPGPVLAGSQFYQPDDPTSGFQKALDQLAPTGGTLQLPGGRYRLSRPLRVPSNVTLTGYGSGTVLLVGHNGAIEVQKAQNVTLRDLAIEGNWSQFLPANVPNAVQVSDSRSITIQALDIRGFCDTGLSLYKVGPDSVVRDCRVTRSGGCAFRINECEGLTLESNSAVRCGNGFEVTGGKVKLLANLASHHRNGFLIRGGQPYLLANNAHMNRASGFHLEQVEGAIVMGNTAASNNRELDPLHAGIRLGRNARNCRVLYNVCGDEQVYATQRIGILLVSGAENNQIIGNVTAPLATPRPDDKSPSLVDQSSAAQVKHNWTRTLLPSNDSLEVIGER